MRIALTHNLKTSNDEKEAEFDTRETLEALLGYLRKLGHEPWLVSVDCSVKELIERLEMAAPDLIFNIAEGRVGKYREAFYPALFEQLGLPYTGSDLDVLALTSNKQRTKDFLDTVGSPFGFVIDNQAKLIKILENPGLLSYPLIVKPNFEGSSKGITAKSVIRKGLDNLEEVATSLLQQYPDGILIEEYKGTLDVSVGWIEGIGSLPATVYRYGHQGLFQVYGLELKQTGQNKVIAEMPAKLPEQTLRTLKLLTDGITAELGVRGICRLDFRVQESAGRTENGEQNQQIWFLEANALPSLAPGPDAEIYKAAELIGMGGPEMVLDAVIKAAIKRWGLV